MEAQPNPSNLGPSNLGQKKPITTYIGAGILWLLTLVLGLECIVAVKGIFYLIFARMSGGGGVVTAEKLTSWLVFFLGIVFLIFIVGSTEYHRTRIGKRESWRLFAWSLAVEVSIILLYIIL